MKKPLKRMWVVPTAALLLTFGASPAALAASRATDSGSLATTTNPAAASGPLGVFGGLTGGLLGLPELPELPELGSARSATTSSAADQSQAERRAIIQLVRQKMDATDQATLDQLLTSEDQQQAEVAGTGTKLTSTIAELDALIDEYLGVKSAAVESITTTTTGAAVASVVFKVSAGWVFPVAGTHSFGDTFGAPRYAGGYHTHKGTDIMCARNTPLVAVVSGVVSRTNPFDTGLGGMSVWLKGNDGNSYYYAHLTSIQSGIKAGVRVTAAQVLGYAGNSGDAAGGQVHLHFEIHPNGGAAIDPYLVLKGAAKISDLVAATTSTTTATPTTTSTTSTTETAPTASDTSTPTEDPNASPTTTGVTESDTTIVGSDTTAIGEGSTTTTTTLGVAGGASPSTTLASSLRRVAKP